MLSLIPMLRGVSLQSSFLQPRLIWMLAASPYQIMVQDGRVHDIDALDYDRWYVQASPSVSLFI